MDAPAMRRWVADIHGELLTIEKRRGVLLNMLRSVEEWISIDTAQSRTSASEREASDEQPEKIPVPRTRIATHPSRRLNRDVVVGIVHRAGGAPVHAREIGERAMTMGYWSDSKRLAATVDSVLRQAIQSGEPIESLGGRNYRSLSTEQPGTN